MLNSNKNIELSYLYRDAANYKIPYRYVFKNPDNLKMDDIRRIILDNLEDGLFFRPNDWRLIKPSFGNFVQELDHEWCEFNDIDYTTEDNTSNLSITEFLKSINLS